MMGVRARLRPRALADSTGVAGPLVALSLVVLVLLVVAALRAGTAPTVVEAAACTLERALPDAPADCGEADEEAPRLWAAQWPWADPYGELNRALTRLPGRFRINPDAYTARDRRLRDDLSNVEATVRALVRLHAAAPRLLRMLAARSLGEFEIVPSRQIPHTMAPWRYEAILQDYATVSDQAAAIEALGDAVLQTIVPDLWVTRERYPLSVGAACTVLRGPTACGRLGLGTTAAGDSPFLARAPQVHAELWRLCHGLVDRVPRDAPEYEYRDFPRREDCEDPFGRRTAWHIAFATIVLRGREAAVRRFGREMVDFVTRETREACRRHFGSGEGCELPDGLDRR
jgi:hypothetical protein